MLTKHPTIHPKTKKLIVPVDGMEYDGKPLYRYANALDYGNTREVMFRVFDQTLTRNIDDAELIKSLTRLIKAINVNDSNAAKMIAYSLIEMVKDNTPIDGLFNIAALYYFTLEEDIETFDMDVNKAKVAHFKAQPLGSFFLPTLLKTLGKYKEKSQSELALMLTNQAEKAGALMEIINKAMPDSMKTT
jgi:hypothetical protein